MILIKKDLISKIFRNDLENSLDIEFFLSNVVSCLVMARSIQQEYRTVFYQAFSSKKFIKQQELSQIYVVLLDIDDK